MKNMTNDEKDAAIYSARYILTEFYEDGTNGVHALAKASGYPPGVIHSALEAIFGKKIEMKKIEEKCEKVQSPLAKVL
jgi:hypothetical protein